MSLFVLYHKFHKVGGGCVNHQPTFGRLCGKEFVVFRWKADLLVCVMCVAFISNDKKIPKAKKKMINRKYKWLSIGC